MNKSRLYNIFLLSCVILILAGCRGGGGGGSSGEGAGLLRSSSGDVIGIVDTGSDGSGSDSGDTGGSLPFTPVANPEPSSFLLLASGLIGMAIYAKTKLKSRTKK